MRLLIKNAHVVLPDGNRTEFRGGRGCAHRRYRSGRAAGRDEVIDASRPAPDARRDRRSGPFPRAGTDAQGRPCTAPAGPAQRGRHDLPRNAEHQSGGHDAGPPRREARSGRREIAGELRLLHRRDADNVAELQAGAAHAGDQDFHRLQHRRSAGRRAGRRSNESSPKRRCRSPRIAKTKRPCARTPPDSPARTTSPITRGFATTPAAVIATRRAIDLAFRHNHRFHVLHVSTADETELFADHRDLITAEACPHHLVVQRRRLRAARHAGADESVDQDAPTTTPALAGAARWPNPGDRHRSRAAHARRKTAALPAFALGLAGGRELAGADAQPGPSRPLHAGAGRPLDVRRPGPRLGYRRQRPHRRRLRCRPGAGRSRTNAARSATKNRKPNAAGAPGTANDSPAGPSAPG